MCSLDPGVGSVFPVAVHLGVPVQHGRQGRQRRRRWRRIVQPAAAAKVESDRSVHGVPVGAGGLRGHRHGDVRHPGRLDVPGQHVFLRDQPVQDWHRELRAGGRRQRRRQAGRRRRTPDEAGHQIRLLAARHGHHSHVLRPDARGRAGPGAQPENGHRAVFRGDTASGRGRVQAPKLVRLTRRLSFVLLKTRFSLFLKL